MLISDKKMRQEMLFGENDNWFHDVSNKLLKGQYKYRKAIETAVLKENGNFRSLEIVSFRDVVVQKAFFLVLSGIFEKQDYLRAYNEKISKKFSRPNRYKDSTSFIAMFYQKFNSRFNFQKKKTINLSEFSLGFTAKKSVHSVMRTIKMS